MVERIATATSDAVTVRMLSADGTALLPVCAYHPDPDAARAISSVMSETADASTGLWAEVLRARRPRRWQVGPGGPPGEASPSQASFIHRYRVRAVLGLPLLDQDAVVGGLALFRLGVDRPYDDDEQALAEDCAGRIGPALGLLRAVVEHPRPDREGDERGR